jgi:hypothetical protein
MRSTIISLLSILIQLYSFGTEKVFFAPQTPPKPKILVTAVFRTYYQLIN